MNPNRKIKTRRGHKPIQESGQIKRENTNIIYICKCGVAAMRRLKAITFSARIMSIFKSSINIFVEKWDSCIKVPHFKLKIMS